jgi:hypothetical protein
MVRSMSADSISSRDNRRLIVRVFSQELLFALTELARAYDTDVISVLVFTGIWTANVARLSPRPALRYADVRDIPPDSLRLPVSEEELARRLCLPRSIVTVYVRELIEAEMVEATESGLVVPAAVVARMASIETLNVTFARAQQMAERLRDAGLSLDEPAFSKPQIGK